MIDQLKKLDGPFPVLCAMHQTDFKFYLTGSRVFGMAVDSSDYDFFVQDSESIHFWLRTAGFSKVSSPENYADNQITGLYRMQGVDVQVVYDDQLKLKAQAMLLDNRSLYIGLNKMQRSALWNLLFTLVA